MLGKKKKNTTASEKKKNETVKNWEEKPKRKRPSKQTAISVSVIALGSLLMVGSGFVSSGEDVVSINAMNVDSSNNNKLVYTKGTILAATITDPLFGITSNDLELSRIVEYYEQNPDDGTLEWRPHTESTPTREKPLTPGDWNTDPVQLGAFTLSNTLAAKIHKSSRLAITDELYQSLPEKTRAAFKLHEDTLFFGKSPTTPRKGDMRVYYEVVATGEASVLAQQSSNMLSAYQGSNGKIESISLPAQTVEQMVENSSVKQPLVNAWLVRGFATIFILLGAGLLIKNKRGKTKTDDMAPQQDETEMATTEATAMTAEAPMEMQITEEAQENKLAVENDDAFDMDVASTSAPTTDFSADPLELEEASNMAGFEIEENIAAPEAPMDMMEADDSMTPPMSLEGDSEHSDNAIAHDLENSMAGEEPLPENNIAMPSAPLESQELPQNVEVIEPGSLDDMIMEKKTAETNLEEAPNADMTTADLEPYTEGEVSETNTEELVQFDPFADTDSELGEAPSPQLEENESLDPTMQSISTDNNEAFTAEATPEMSTPEVTMGEAPNPEFDPFDEPAAIEEVVEAPIETQEESTEPVAMETTEDFMPVTEPSEITTEEANTPEFNPFDEPAAIEEVVEAPIEAQEDNASMTAEEEITSTDEAAMEAPDITMEEIEAPAEAQEINEPAQTDSEPYPWESGETSDNADEDEELPPIPQVKEF